MNKVLIDPTLIFIAKENWSDEIFRDSYLEKMIETFQEIDSDPSLKLIWSYALEEILWLDLKYRPWSELNNNNNLVPILYKFFRRNVDYLEHEGILATSLPKLTCIDPKITFEYYSLTNDLIILDDDFAYFGDENPIEFTSNCGKNYLPYSCSSKYDISMVNINSKLQNIDTIEKKNIFLTELLDSYMISQGITKINDFQFTNSFVRRIIDLEHYDLVELIEKLSLRLKYNSTQSRGCPILQDEYITANSINEFRIRISPRPSSKRVHYIFNSGKIEFKSYYGQGEHDAGL